MKANEGVEGVARAAGIILPEVNITVLESSAHAKGGLGVEKRRWGGMDGTASLWYPPDIYFGSGHLIKKQQLTLEDNYGWSG